MNRNTIIGAGHILVSNGPICKFLPKLRENGSVYVSVARDENTGGQGEKSRCLKNIFLPWEGSCSGLKRCTVFLPRGDEPLCVGSCIPRCDDISRTFLFPSKLSFLVGLLTLKRRWSRNELIFTARLQQSGTVLSTFMKGIKCNPKNHYFLRWEYRNARRLLNVCKVRQYIGDSRFRPRSVWPKY